VSELERIKALEEKVERLYAKQEIHDAIMRYCRGVDRLDEELASSAFHTDGVFENGPLRFVGAEIGREQVQRAGSQYKSTTHGVANELVEIRGNSAYCESYWIAHFVIERDGGERLMLRLTRNIDYFECREGIWKIARRRVIRERDSILPIEPPSPPPFFGPLRSREDISYWRKDP
jgi:hypothetical protein